MMAEIIRRVEVFGTFAQCKICECEMVCNDFPTSDSPPKYPHKCINCGHTELLDTRYPIITYEPIRNKYGC